MHSRYNIERIAGNWVGYDSFGNSWKIVKRRNYWDAFANIPREEKLCKVHYLCANTLNDIACLIRDKGGKAK
jgi:hypothetical protein